MAPTGNDKSTAPQFVGVVGVAFAVIIVLFVGTFGVRRCLPRRFQKSSQEPERGLPAAGEISPLLPAPIAVPTPPEDYQQAADYGATALSPTPADKRESSQNHEAHEEGMAETGNIAKAQGKALARQSRRPSSAGSSQHSASERLFGAPTSLAHSRSPHGGWTWHDGGGGNSGRGDGSGSD
ncbi:hypothetical protein BKA67DRAFT_533480 [Truncatella angustata]|uniref:Transmembrane protein n=1 Tax=Truncatella angustata TaxID=152316 RepID=A0A9P9A1P9_9PEZI|nr:uncharacterized protein BKA67DRAFT_533480 [Truncatella angustata]KAH6658324.1 hypothetical protein BKA67DRAFT_533480 [Truncatella angustata]